VQIDWIPMIGFAVASLLLIMIPGPDQALITRNCLMGGRRAGLLTMVGGLLGVSVHAAAASAGVSALLVASPKAFAVLKAAGAAYLLWLGARMMRSLFHGRDAHGDASAGRSVAGRGSLRQGFHSNALNPKVALFFVTFLPQFLPQSGAAHREALVLSGLFAALYAGWFGMYVLAVQSLGRLLRRPRVAASIEQLTGGLLIAAAVRLFVTQPLT
jgi:threonine/homoserine/homoserine lactone efflux protein